MRQTKQTTGAVGAAGAPEARDAATARRARVFGVACLTGCVAAVGCDRPGPARTDADRALATRVTGVWDAELRLDASPLGTTAGARARAAGALTLLATARPVGGADAWLGRAATHEGVYDLDAGPLGFTLPAPDAVAGLAATTSAPDSLALVLPAGATDRALVLRGTVAGDVARGTWRYTSSGRSLSGWRGTFQLRRRSARIPAGVPARTP